jgi:hypothetical protein
VCYNAGESQRPFAARAACLFGHKLKRQNQIEKITAANFWPPMAEALELPEQHVSFGAMIVGYPKFKYQRLPLRKEPKISWR